ncbi:alpha/beta hydrolase [Oleiharenicola lentus]|uniref:alpha/beta hydrolase n=1 Tax=Oleiharenicola lentus TaxID=2508720 RepID=UPI003F67CB9C
MNPAKFTRLVLLFILGGLSACAQEMKITPEMLAGWIKQYPDADTNKDGVLTEAEALTYYAKIQAAQTAAASSKTIAPTITDLSYGPDKRNVLDFWQAKSEQPTPVIIYIHGGGFVMGDKSGIRSMKIVQQALAAGVSVASINYRYISKTLPLQDVLRDCARAVQFVRSQAKQLNIDKTRVAACGNSAGAGTSMWLAFHDDMADPQNADPVFRESTRLACAVSWDGQFSYDMPQWADYFGEENRQRFGGIYNSPGLYGLKTDAEVASPVGAKLRAECDFYAMISADDPPVYIGCGLKTDELKDVNQYLHHPKHSQLLYQRCQEKGVTAVAKIPALGISPAAGGPQYGEPFMFLFLKNSNLTSTASK